MPLHRAAHPPVGDQFIEIEQVEVVHAVEVCPHRGNHFQERERRCASVGPAFGHPLDAAPKAYSDFVVRREGEARVVVVAAGEIGNRLRDRGLQDGPLGAKGDPVELAAHEALAVRPTERQRGFGGGEKRQGIAGVRIEEGELATGCDPSMAALSEQREPVAKLMEHVRLHPGDFRQVAGGIRSDGACQKFALPEHAPHAELFEVPLPGCRHLGSGRPASDDAKDPAGLPPAIEVAVSGIHAWHPSCRKRIAGPKVQAVAVALDGIRRVGGPPSAEFDRPRQYVARAEEIARAFENSPGREGGDAVDHLEDAGFAREQRARAEGAEAVLAWFGELVGD